MKTFFTLCVLLYATFFSTAQILVNTNWSVETGLPDPDLAWSASIAHGPFMGPIIAGNTMTTTEGANILTTVMDRAGDIIWQQEWNGTDSGNDYATCVAYSGSMIVVGGATYDSTQAAYDYIILAYNATDGTLLWSQDYNGTGNGHDAPASIIIDSGDVFITGGSFGSTTLLDYATLRLRGGDGLIIWQQRYDYSGLYDAAVKISILSGKAVIVGASGDAFNDWDFCTVRYNSSNGTFIDEKRVENASYYFDQPTDMLQDSLGNIFVCGRTENLSGDEDIKLLKMDSNLDIVWQKTIDVEGEDDAATAIAIDDVGNIYLTGYYTTAESTKGFVAYKLNTSGNTVWYKKFPAPWGGDFVGTDVARRGDDYIYTGYLEGQSGSTDMLVYLLDKDGNQKLFTTADLLNAGIANEKGLVADFVDDMLLYSMARCTALLPGLRTTSVLAMNTLHAKWTPW